ncbi:MAG TPA: HAD family acid phosphatase [Gemmatimonadaceae bacterium]|nr:HAD family acid phosphatase [Gemmatimonadaceae bacterium]
MNSLIVRRFLVAAVSAAALAACAPAVRTAPAPAGPPALSLALRWMRRSAEYRAATRQTYRLAEQRLNELAPAVERGRWGVILDADETVLDNSEYAVRRESLDSGYTEASWTAWVKEEAAGTVPGAVAFTRRVQALGGRVVIVTNRADAVCGETRATLRKVGVEADAVLCQAADTSDKNPRFLRVERGTAAPGLPPLAVLEWVGDNIQDFPRLTQAARGDTTTYALFGRRYFVLPNPDYGSWQANRMP